MDSTNQDTPLSTTPPDNNHNDTTAHVVTAVAVSDNHHHSNDDDNVPTVLVSAIADIPTAVAADVELGQRSEYTCATIIKRKNVNLGIEIVDDHVQSLSSSLQQALPFEPHDKIVAINGKSLLDNDISALEGPVTIVAHNPTGSSHTVDAMVEKPTPSTSVGIGIRQNVYGSLVISKVIDNGLYGHSLLNIGDRLLSINGVACHGLDPQTAIAMIRASPRFVTLRTAPSHVVVMGEANNDENNNNHGTTDIISILAATTTTNNEAVDAFNENIMVHHACFCVWMIVLSMVIISITIFYKVNQ